MSGRVKSRYTLEQIEVILRYHLLYSVGIHTLSDILHTLPFAELDNLYKAIGIIKKGR
jgi:hypothetical protein